MWFISLPIYYVAAGGLAQRPEIKGVVPRNEKKEHELTHREREKETRRRHDGMGSARAHFHT